MGGLSRLSAPVMDEEWGSEGLGLISCSSGR